jgi:hypothetical protein
MQHIVLLNSHAQDARQKTTTQSQETQAMKYCTHKHMFNIRVQATA